ncbi:MAG: glycosyltransferase family 2 protein [Candidatus Sumerlaeaceae bacterium]|nr:glycosyltransferase family 2 protein [Candidatus Sumerlaeaceae bacterium]
MAQKTGISVVIPVYNSEAILEPLFSRLAPVLNGLAGEAWEVILVDDGSADGSWAVASRLASTERRIVAVRMMRNYGQHNAVIAGVRLARYDTIITMDDDLQHPPEVLPALFEKFSEGWDLVYGPPEREQHGVMRDIASRLTKLALSAAMGTDMARHVTALRVFRTQLRNAFADYHGPSPNVDVLLSWATRRVTAVAVRHEVRAVGRSNYTFSRLVTHAWNMITGFSALPLRVATIMGFGFVVFGALLFLYVLARYVIAGSPVQGFPFLASSIAIFSGVQLFCLGVMGEYIARIHSRSLERPTYVVREILNQETDP